MYPSRKSAIAAVAIFIVLFALPACDKGTADHGNIVAGLIDATEIDIASKIPGRIKEMKVREGDRVIVGQQLLTLTSYEIEAKIAQVNAGIDASKSQLNMARKGARSQEKRAIYKGLTTSVLSQSLTTPAINSLPLSLLRTCFGISRSMNSSSRVCSTSAEFKLRLTVSAKHSRLYSSITHRKSVWLSRRAFYPARNRSSRHDL